jgi:autophagy-related protein 2
MSKHFTFENDPTYTEQANVLPLSLHVDQDTLDFAKRFMLFKDDSLPDDKPPSSEFFLQRLEVDAVPVRFDYKPKRIDYGGLRSGRTGELMNIMALDGADFVLKHLILYGVDGADQLHKMLNDIWMDDILTNQLPGVLAGLAPIRPFVNVGSGIRDLVVVPMREYRKDGRIVRSIQKGAVAFARTTASELARLGAKVAIGTQNVLQGTESLLSPISSSQAVGFSSSSSQRRGIDEDWDDDFAAHSPSLEEKRVISNYANQPLNVVTGVRAAYRGLERDLMTARDAIIAIGGEVRESESAQGVVGAVARHGATVILRPAIATTRAIGTALLGAGNMLDKDSKRKIEEVSFTILSSNYLLLLELC